ncbi:DUF4190 domain-containing protein [Isoptericola haloaureus]|uniref:DUF4190 domain-containing protein n=1 Tax=Isoptericola haloaureus TaxID=1542902 RepID=A0ABU7ZA21_9MICO
MTTPPQDPSHVADPFSAPTPSGGAGQQPSDGSAPPSGPPAAGPQPPYAAPSDPRTDGVSIAALVTGILGLALIPLGLGIAALVRIKRSGAAGKGLAIAGIVLGALSTVGWTVLVALFAAFVGTGLQEAVDEGLTEGFQEVTGTHLVVGDCFEPPADLTSGDPLQAVDCGVPHTAEVFGVDDVAADAFPGVETMQVQAEDFCLDVFGDYVGVDYMDSALQVIYFHPSELTWSVGDRRIICGATTMDGSPLHDSVAGSGV